MSKKILCTVLAILMLFCACGRADIDEGPATIQQETEQSVEKIHGKIEKPIQQEINEKPQKAPTVESKKDAPQKEEIKPDIKGPAKEEKPEAEEKPIEPEQKHKIVSIRICGDENVGQILAKTSIPWEEGMTAFSVLQKVTREHGIQMEFSGGETNAYIEGIANLYEFDSGPLSGWMYRVNGKAVQKSSSACSLSPDDFVEWLYTLNMGKDLD